MKQSTNSLQRDWNEFIKLTWHERWLLFKIFLLLPLVAAGLHLLNFQRLRSVLLRFSPDSPDVSGGVALEQASITSRLVLAVACRMPFTVTCLVRSTTLWYLLRRQGIASEIRLGVKQDEGEFHAHAWVEVNGVVINDEADMHQQYGAFDQITFSDSTKKI